MKYTVTDQKITKIGNIRKQDAL